LNISNFVLHQSWLFSQWITLLIYFFILLNLLFLPIDILFNLFQKNTNLFFYIFYFFAKFAQISLATLQLMTQRISFHWFILFFINWILIVLCLLFDPSLILNHTFLLLNFSNFNNLLLIYFFFSSFYWDHILYFFL